MPSEEFECQGKAEPQEAYPKGVGGRGRANPANREPGDSGDKGAEQEGADDVPDSWLREGNDPELSDSPVDVGEDQDAEPDQGSAEEQDRSLLWEQPNVAVYRPPKAVRCNSGLGRGWRSQGGGTIDRLVVPKVPPCFHLGLLPRRISRTLTHQACRAHCSLQSSRP